jgi:hypothetical protein
MSVRDIEIDLTKYTGRKDFQVLTHYINENKYAIMVRRLDSEEGWTENIKVLACHSSAAPKTIVVGSSSTSEKFVEVDTEYTIYKSDTPTAHLPKYTALPIVVPQRISRKRFNLMFGTDVIVLPENIYAVGIKNGLLYIYNEKYESFYMIELTVKHIAGVAIKENLYREIYFLICSHDGYLEGHYPESRVVQYSPSENEYEDLPVITLNQSNTYPLLHKNATVLAQSVQLRVAHTVAVPDRYYFYLNRYNEYRSIHGGIRFSSKKNRIVFASNPRGTKYNFTSNRTIQLSPREYFNSTAVPKINIDVPDWIDRNEMINYKYILDIDGNASTWDATAWKLNSGSVILKSASEWKQWFYEFYKPWTHFVPIKDDFSDIQEQYAWCENNQDKCLAMITNCKALFQKAYRFTNVMAYTSSMLLGLQQLKPYTIGSRRLFLYTFGDPSGKSEIINVQTSIYEYPKRVIFKTEEICRRLFPTDIIVYINIDLTDIVNFDPAEFLRRYDSFNSKIVFGAERNLWPETLEQERAAFENLGGKDSAFKYMNCGFFCAEVGEMRTLLEEQVFEISSNLCDAEYFARAYLSKRYSLTLDYNQLLVLNTYLATEEDITRVHSKGTPFIHHNAGRPLSNTL